MIVTRLLPKTGPRQPGVYAKGSLEVATPWAFQTDLRVRELTVNANKVDTCSLVFQYGRSMKQVGEFSHLPYRTVPPIELKGKYIKVPLDPSGQVGLKYWYGYVLEETRERVTDSQGNVVGRAQAFTAVGLEYFLGRVQINSAVLHDGTEIGRPLDFNGGDGARFLSGDRRLLANMHPAIGSDGAYCFYDPRDTTASPQEWNATRIARHIVEYHAPKNSAGDPAPCKYVIDPSVANFLDDWRPTVRVENRTPLEVLNSLMSNRRALQWWGYYSDSAENSPTGEFILRVQSHAKTAVALENGGSVAACTLQTELDIDGDTAVGENAVGNEGHRNYDRLRFRGARQTTTCTLGVADGNLVQGWSSALETLYKSAAVLSDGYGGLGEDAKKKRNDAVRREERFRDVYSLFKIPDNWDGQAGDGKGGVKSPVFVNLSSAGTVTGSQQFFTRGLRVLEHLAIAEGGGAPDKNRPEYMPPIVVVKVATSPDKWQFVEKLTHSDYSEGTAVSAAINANYDVYTAQEVPGVRLRSTRAPHSLAKNHFTGAEPYVAAPELDWETIRATVTLEADTYAEGVWPVSVGSDRPVQELVIDAGDAYRLDYIVTGTLIDLDEGEDVAKEVQSAYAGTIAVENGVATISGDTWPTWISPSSIIVVGGERYKVVSRDSDTQLTLQDAKLNVDPGASYELHSHLLGIIRDDRPRLIDLAKFAYQWYDVERNSLRVKFSRLDFVSFNLAQMITRLGAINQQEVNTNIASITWNFYQGTTTIQTAPNNTSIPELLA